MESPLLNDNDITGARYVLLYIKFGEDAKLDEIGDITDYIQEQAGSTADVIWGYGVDESLGDKLSITIIATGFQTSPDIGVEALAPKVAEKVKINLDDNDRKVSGPLNDPFGQTSTPPTKSASEEEEIYIKKAVVEQPVEPASTTTPELEFKIRVEEPKKVETEQQVVQEQAQPKKQVFVLDENDEIQETSIEEVKAASVSQEDENKGFEPPYLKPIERQEIMEKRMAGIRDLNNKLRTPSGISQLENEPAFKRRKVQLLDQKKASDSNISRFTLNGDSELKNNNSFLHDNVD